MDEYKFKEIEKTLERLLQGQEKLEGLLLGDGDSKPGLSNRVLALEKKAASQDKIIWTIVGAVISVTVTFVINQILH